MKKILTLLTAILLVAAFLVGCGGGDSDNDNTPQNNQQNQQPQTSADSGSNATPSGDTSTPDGDTSSPDSGNSSQAAPSDVNTLTGNDLSYVMVYNPKIYEESSNFSTGSLETGSFSSQIDVDINRATGLDPTVMPFGQENFADLPWDKIDLSGNRGDGVSTVYKLGDSKEFYGYVNGVNSDKTSATFTCYYAGTHANIWVYGTPDTETIEELGTEFDNTIYEECVQAFGKPRFDAKVNLLFYYMPENVMGMFCPIDLFATGELNAAEVEEYSANIDHNVLHINTNYAYKSSLRTATYGTLAHEFQHLLCMTGFFTYQNLCDTWLNEGMSGYIEEELYPGGKEESGHFYAFLTSDLIRYGQSLYNFNTNQNTDIGVYGSVYYFSQYLTTNADDDVFSKIHKYWRDSYDEIDEARAMYENVPSQFRDAISNKVSYPSSYKFATKEQEWMSKLTLDFYLSVLSKGRGTPAAFGTIDPANLVYDQLDGAKIEGGGRIILALKGDSFEIPTDADKGLVYVGLDSDFNVVTDIVCK